MTQEKHCKDCAHYVRLGEFDMCGAARDTISGEPIGFTDIERAFLGLRTNCGATGKLWTPKHAPSPFMRRWQRLLERLGIRVAG